MIRLPNYGFRISDCGLVQSPSGTGMSRNQQAGRPALHPFRAASGGYLQLLAPFGR